MSTVRPELQSAIDALHPNARIVSLAGDASTRRFHRVYLESGGTRIVMDYGTRFEGETDDVRLARIFERAALPVARVLDVLPEAGALLLEDLGDTTLEIALADADAGRGRARPELYRAAVGLAADVARRGTEALSRSERSDGPSLDEDRFRFEMQFFLDHYVVGFLKQPPTTASLGELLFELAGRVATHPRVMCHRDYHSRNLMVLPDDTLAMVDIQDARWGPDTYDLASLLRDAYVDLEEREVAEYLDLYRTHRGHDESRSAFVSRFHATAAQRMIKALGTFGYQVSRLGRDRYRDAIPRTLERLARLLPADPTTRPLGSQLQALGLFSS